MQKKLVRCYHAQALGPTGHLEDVLFTLPDFGYDIRLYSCLSCGALFTASGEDEHHTGVPLAARKDQSRCPDCSAPLATSLQPYPQTFRVSDGRLCHFELPREYPPDSSSTTREVWDLYS